MKNLNILYYLRNIEIIKADKIKKVKKFSFLKFHYNIYIFIIDRFISSENNQKTSFT